MNNELVELLSAKVHDAWWEEKRKQGFHAPNTCLHRQTEFDGTIPDYKFRKWCDHCHTDMYPYDELSENVKEYDRVTVRTVLKAMEDLGMEVQR